MAGLIHIYCGDGKGKTTAATGLAVRCAGAGGRVLFLQFFKDGSSSEIGVLRLVPGIDVRVVTEHYGFFKRMTPEERENARRDFSALLERALCDCENADLLVLDEVISAYNHGMVPRERLRTFLEEKPAGLEVVMTGRDPAPELMALADYVTRMEKVRHPFDRGIGARRGVEF